MQCRACRRFNCEETMDMSYVVPTDGKTLYDYFNDCTQLKATSKDDLPKILCINCIHNLEKAYNFRQEARRSDEELKHILAFAKNEIVLVCESAVQSEVIEEIEESTLDQLSRSPKKETLSFYPEQSNELEDIEIGSFDLLSATPKIESSLVYEPTDNSQLLEEVVEDSSVDPLSASGHSGQSETKPSTVIGDHQHELNLLKEEIKIEFSPDVFENFNEDQFEDSTYDDNEDNSDNYELKRRKTHICDLCVYKCSTQNELKKHTFELHKDDIICLKCSKVFELPRELQLHKTLVHDTDSNICCYWCKNSSPMPNDELTKHLQTKHNSIYLKFFPRLRMLGRGDGPFGCERCQQFFKSIYQLADHIQGHKFECPLCRMSFKKNGAYRSHIKRIHNQSLTSLKAILTGNEEINMQFHCSLCTKQFKLKKTFQQHMKSKHKESPCSSENSSNSKDPQGSANDFREQMHIDDVEKSATVPEVEGEYENNKLVECKYCHREIPGSRIVQHEKRHAYRLKQQSKYICSYCSREFKSESSVKLHEKNIHLCDKPERKECPICLKDVDATYLKTHLAKVHTSERKFACDICGDLFKSSTLLYYHKKLHLDRKHPCAVCNKGFIRPSDLRVHMRIHTGEEPYACHICDRRFKIKVRLNYHLQKHAGIKRKCNVCGKEFNHVKQLKNHSYKHTGMPYRCSVCKYACAQRDVFRKHLLRMHDMTMTDVEYRAMFKANTGRNPCVKTLYELQSESKDVEVD